MWSDLRSYYGGDPATAQRGFAQRLDQVISNDGLLQLRKGVKDRGVLIRVAYFKPNLVTSDAVLENYRANRLTVVKRARVRHQAGRPGAIGWT